MTFFLAQLLWLSCAQSAVLTHEPRIGDVTANSAIVWARAGAPGTFELRVLDAERQQIARVSDEARPEDDLCLHWTVTGLEPAHEYRCEIVARSTGLPEKDSGVGAAIAACTVRTPEELPKSARIAFGSCSSDTKSTDQPIWGMMRGADAVVLLGDMPYIETSDLAVQRERRRSFWSQPYVVQNLRDLPVYTTWDDHDFGANDCDGTFPGKERSRQAFLEYGANSSYGEDGQGIYTSFRRGPIEVFLLDTRWFSRTEKSASDATQPGLLGARQWAWLKRGLESSTAPFKILACGMIWNDAVRLGKSDYWGAYRREREDLFRFLGEKAISGVVLVGGDIHRSRMVRHATRELVGYEITELITSPLAQDVMQTANVLHPGLVWDAGLEQTCMIVSAESRTAESATLTARFLQASIPEQPPEVFKTVIASSHLKRTNELKSVQRPTGFLNQTIQAQGREHRYAVYVPRAWTPETRWPALVFLHGMGECGTDGALQLAVGLAPAVMRKPESWPFVVICPQKPAAADEWEHHEVAVMAMLDRAIRDYSIDPKRIALTGLSQGGHGTLSIGALHAERFRALAPICAYPAPPARGWRDFVRDRDWTEEQASAAATTLAIALADKPMWIFHGDADSSVSWKFSEIVARALEARGAKPRFTKFAGVGHNAWDKAYQDEGLAEWLVENTR